MPNCCSSSAAPSVAADERVRLRFVRNRQLDPPATGWELHTDSTGLPCSVALSWLPALSQLGDACVFQGSVWCEQRPAGWEAELRGVFRQVDLEQLVTRQFPHKLSGSADVDPEPLPDPCRPGDRGPGTFVLCGWCDQPIAVGRGRAITGAAATTAHGRCRTPARTSSWHWIFR